MDNKINSQDTRQDFKKESLTKGNQTTSGKNQNLGQNANVSNAVDSAQEVAREAKASFNDLKDRIADRTAPAVDYLKTNFSSVGERAQDYIQSTGSLVRRYPFYSLIGAVAIGTFVGMAIARPSSKSSSMAEKV